MAHCSIRQAERGDAQLIYDFIVKMSQYEHLEQEVDITVDSIERSVFDLHEAQVIICELEGEAVGFTLYFYNYSTFKGKKGLYIEDIFVDRQFRGRGFGKAMFAWLASKAIDEQCRRMEWIVLDWNQPSIDFYRSLGAEPLSDWTVFRLTEQKLGKVAEQIVNSER